MDQIINEGVMLIIILLAIVICCVGFVSYFIVNRTPVHEEDWEKFFQLGTQPDVNYKLAPINQGTHIIDNPPSEGGEFILIDAPTILETPGARPQGEIQVGLFNEEVGAILCLLDLTKQNREFAFQADRAWKKSLNMGEEINITVKLPSQVI